jgi:hypothetical protein
MSIHRYEGGVFYPGSTFGGADMVGDEAGEGTYVTELSSSCLFPLFELKSLYQERQHSMAMRRDGGQRLHLRFPKNRHANRL